MYVKRFERSNRLETALYKTCLFYNRHPRLYCLDIGRDVTGNNKIPFLCFRTSTKFAFSTVAVICALLTLLVYTPPLQYLRRPIPVRPHNSRTAFALSTSVAPRVGKVKNHSNPKKKTAFELSTTVAPRVGKVKNHSNPKKKTAFALSTTVAPRVGKVKNHSNPKKKTVFALSTTVAPRVGKVKKHSNPKKKTASVSAGRSRGKTMRAHPRLDGHASAKENKTRSQKSILILIWLPISQLGHESCSSPIPCVFTNNHSLYNESDAVLVDTRNVATLRPSQRLPTFRPPRQHWIAYLREPPTGIKLNVKPYETWFNWTFTYSMNGDVVIPYGMCLPTKDKVAKDPSSITNLIRRVYGKSANSMPWIKRNAKHAYVPENHAKSKTRLVSWVVSNCQTPSLRERYVAELKSYVEITIFGKCSGKIINKTDRIEFFADLFKRHKFYLAFENALCPDYITEKVWTRLTANIVPIVLGGADYTARLPPHSYINVKDYSSPKELAKYLHKLDKNDTLYSEYFAWKKNYSCFIGTPRASAKCQLCRMLNENRNKVNAIPDINTFWGKDTCIPVKNYYRGIARDVLGKRVSKEYGPKWPSFS